MNCQDVKENLSAYLDEQLDKETAKKVAAHLLACNSCRNEWQDLKETTALLRNLPEVQAPPEFRMELRKKLTSIPRPAACEDKKQGILEKARQMAKSPWYKVAAVAAMFGMTLGITTLWNGGNINNIDIINHPSIAQTGSYTDAENELGEKITEHEQLPGSNTSASEVNTQQVNQGSNNEKNGQVSTGLENQQPDRGAEQNVSSKPAEDSTPPAGRPESVSLTTVTNVPTSKIDGTNLIATSTYIKIAVSDINAVYDKVLSIVEKYNGSVVKEKNPLNFNIPVENYSAVIAELGNIDENLFTKSSQENLNDEYQALADELVQKAAKEAELMAKLETENNSEELEKQLSIIQSSIKNLEQKMNLIIDKTEKVDIKVEIVSKSAEE